MSATMNGKHEENKTFIQGDVKYRSSPKQGCCHSLHTRNCCIATTIIGAIFLLLGIVIVAVGESLIFGAILKTMALPKGSDRYATWLVPPVQPHLEGYAWNVTNPDEVAQGAKPILVEVGPFIYKAITIKDTRDNLKFNDDGETLTYRPRKFYHFDREQSIGDEETTMITIPNIPLWTGLNKLESGFVKNIKVAVMMSNGLGTPFITVSFRGLLWGYEDDLPCVGAKLAKDPSCPSTKADEEEEEDDGWGDDGDDWANDDSDDDDWKRKKRSLTEDALSSCPLCTAAWPDNYEKMWRPKAEYVNCSCQWGLFRDRNVTLRKSVKMYHGISDLSKKGLVKEFDGKDTMGWWKEGSQCDKIGGQDGGTLPPNVYKEGGEMEIFISLMCRKIKLSYVENVEHAGIRTLRFVPKPNALGSHDDADETRRNPENECFCMKEEGFTCFKSGVYDMGPCKRTADRPMGAPIALSAPHFYQADPSFREAVIGMKPDKEKHQFYVDVVPEFGFPLAIRPRFQLNAILRADKEVPAIANFPAETVVPFLWAQDGYSEPSVPMADKIRTGVGAPAKISKLGGIGFLAIGAVMMLASLCWFWWSNSTKSRASQDIALS